MLVSLLVIPPHFRSVYRCWCFETGVGVSNLLVLGDCQLLLDVVVSGSDLKIRSVRIE